MTRTVSSLFLTEKCYCLKILAKLPRKSYFFQYAFLFLTLWGKSHNNIVLPSYLYSYTRTQIHTLHPAKSERFDSRPTPLYHSIFFLDLPILIPCGSSPTWLGTIITWGSPSKSIIFLVPTWNSPSLALGLHFKVLQVIIIYTSTHQPGTIN